MMDERLIRTEMIYGPEGIARLQASRVAVFGIGGVGGYVIEALARSGVGTIDIVDFDRVDQSNINRQIIATTETVGRYKTEVMAERIRLIAPSCRVNTWQTFFLPDTQDQFDFHAYDYVADAIDTVTGKLLIIEKAKEAGVPVISCMGTGNKTDPSALELADIYETSICPLARVMRRECKRRGIESLKVVYSREKPVAPKTRLIKSDREDAQKEEMETAHETSMTGSPKSAGSQGKKGRPGFVPGSTAFVPPCAGLLMAGEIVNNLAGWV
jgi:tRNA A37 threonylcarbamoyladenosine dehydratase